MSLGPETETPETGTVPGVLAFWTDCLKFSHIPTKNLQFNQDKDGLGQPALFQIGAEGYIYWHKTKEWCPAKILKCSEDINVLKSYTVLQSGEVLAPDQTVPANALVAKKRKATKSVASKEKRQDNAAARESLREGDSLVLENVEPLPEPPTCNRACEICCSAPSPPVSAKMLRGMRTFMEWMESRMRAQGQAAADRVERSPEDWKWDVKGKKRIASNVFIWEDIVKEVEARTSLLKSASAKADAFIKDLLKTYFGRDKFIRTSAGNIPSELFQGIIHYTNTKYGVSQTYSHYVVSINNHRQYLKKNPEGQLSSENHEEQELQHGHKTTGQRRLPPTEETGRTQPSGQVPPPPPPGQVAPPPTPGQVPPPPTPGPHTLLAPPRQYPPPPPPGHLSLPPPGHFPPPGPHPPLPPPGQQPHPQSETTAGQTNPPQTETTSGQPLRPPPGQQPLLQPLEQQYYPGHPYYGQPPTQQPPAPLAGQPPQPLPSTSVHQYDPRYPYPYPGQYPPPSLPPTQGHPTTPQTTGDQPPPLDQQYNPGQHPNEPTMPPTQDTPKPSTRQTRSKTNNGNSVERPLRKRKLKVEGKAGKAAKAKSGGKVEEKVTDTTVQNMPQVTPQQTPQQTQQQTPQQTPHTPVIHGSAGHFSPFQYYNSEFPNYHPEVSPQYGPQVSYG